MTRVRSTVHPGFVEITGPSLVGVVEVPQRHAEALTSAASEGLVQLLDVLCSRGLLVMPAFGIVTTEGDRVRALVRGRITVVLDDGRVVGDDGRLPWRDLDLDDPGDEVVVAAPAPEPEVARGWRRPARLRADAAGELRSDPVAEAVRTGPAETDPVTEPVDDPVTEPVDDPVAEPVEAHPVAEPVEAHRVAEAPLPAAAPAPPADLTLPPPEDGAGTPPAQRVPPSAAPERSIIDSVPWRRAGAAPVEPAAPMAVVPPAAPPADHLDVPPPAPEAPPAAEAPSAPMTPVAPVATRSPETGPVDVTTARASLPRSDDDLDRPVVLAVLCPAGHHSPPHAGRCRTCGREIPPQQPTPIPRPTLGVLRISTGGVVPLDRGVLLGRAPRVNEELPANQRPHLIRVGGVDRDISRNHAEVVLEGWHVLVRDLGSTNGTTVALPGQEPLRLRPTEDQGIEPGTVITLADEVSLTYEVDG